MRAAPAFLFAGLVATSGCGGDRLLRAAEEVKVTAPAHGATVALPLVVRLSTDASTDPDTQLAAFVDRAPMPPGRDLRWLARDDDACRRVPTCPDAGWLRTRGIYVTDGRSVEIDAVPSSVSGGRNRSDDGHRVTVVMLDRDGRRKGEAAASRLFFVPESAS